MSELSFTRSVRNLSNAACHIRLHFIKLFLMNVVYSPMDISNNSYKQHPIVQLIQQEPLNSPFYSN